MEIFVDETIPDQNKLQITKADMYCDNKAYIYCVYCAGITVSFQYNFHVWKEYLFGSISESQIVNSTRVVSMAGYYRKWRHI